MRIFSAKRETPQEKTPILPPFCSSGACRQGGNITNHLLQQEKERCFWRRINYALGKPRGGACFKVQVERGDGDVDDFTEKEAFHGAIWNNIHKKQFVLSEDAPLCQGPLRGLFGYCAVSITAQSILCGTYEYPEDFDLAH